MFGKWRVFAIFFVGPLAFSGCFSSLFQSSKNLKTVQSSTTLALVKPPSRQPATINQTETAAATSAIIDIHSFAVGGPFLTPQGLYFSNGQGGLCQYSSINAFILMNPSLKQSGLFYLPSIPPHNGPIGFCQGSSNGTLPAGNFMVADGSVHWSNGAGGACHYSSYGSFEGSGGTYNMSGVTTYPTFPWDLVSGDGPCDVPIPNTTPFSFPNPVPPGNFITPGGIYFNNGNGGMCQYSSVNAFILMVGTLHGIGLNYYPAIPPGGGAIGFCQGISTLPSGYFFTADGSAYLSDGSGGACKFSGYNDYLKSGGTSNIQNLSLYASFPVDLVTNQGSCGQNTVATKVYVTPNGNNITASLNSALQSCSAGCEIHIPSSVTGNVYLDHSVLVNSPHTTLICDSHDAVLGENFSSDGNENLFSIYGNYFKMQGCSLNTRALAQGAQAIHVMASYGDYGDLVITDPGAVAVGAFSGIRIEQSDTTGIAAQYNSVHDSTINSPYISFGVGTQGNYNLAFNNQMTGCGEAFDINGSESASHDNIFTFNTVINCGIPSYFESASNNQATWNSFVNSGGGADTIRVHLAQGSSASQNILAHNFYDGQGKQATAIWIYANAQSAQVIDEIIQNYSSDAILIDSSSGDPEYSSVSGGTISNSGGCGIHLKSGDLSIQPVQPMFAISLNGTFIQNTQGAGVCIDGGEVPGGLTISNLSFSNNTGGAIANTFTSCNGCSIQ